MKKTKKTLFFITTLIIIIVIAIIGVTERFITEKHKIVELEKFYKKIVKLNALTYICSDMKGNIHQVTYSPYSDKIIIEYEEIAEGMIDWDEINKNKKEKDKKGPRRKIK